MVGGGLAGLAVACLLARRGHLVTLYEAGRLGGKVERLAVGGLLHSAGPSLFTFPEVWRALLGRLGARDPLRLHPLPGLGLHHVPGGPLPLPVPPEHPLFPAWARYEAEVAPLRPAVAALLVTPPRLTDPRFLAASAALGRVMGGHLTAAGWLAARRYPAPLAHALAIHALNAGVGPRAGSALTALLPGLIARDVARVEGGVAALVEVMVTLALGLGVRLHEGTPVTGLDARTGRVTTRLGTHRHDLLISALDPERLATLRGHDPRADLPRSVSGFALYATLPAPTDLPPTSIVAPDDLAAFERDLRARRFPASTLALIHADSRRLSLLLATPPTAGRLGLNHPWVAAQLERLRARLDLPDLEGVPHLILDPAHYARWGAPGGALYGRTYAVWRAGPFHPQPYRLGARLWQVGAGVHPGGGVPAVLGSALMVDELLAEA